MSLTKYHHYQTTIGEMPTNFTIPERYNSSESPLSSNDPSTHNSLVKLPENQYLKSQLGSYYKNNQQTLNAARRSESRLHGNDAERPEQEDIMSKVVGEIETHQQTLKARLTKIRNSELNSSATRDKENGLLGSPNRTSVEIAKRSPNKSIVELRNVEITKKAEPPSPAEKQK